MIRAETIQLVRERTDLVALIGATTKLTRRGKSWKGLCPFHKERSPSFHVTPERGMYHCFGCQEHGNAISFVMKVDAVTFPEAVHILAEKLGIEVEETRVTDDERREQDAKKRDRETLYSLMNLAAVYFEKMLAEHPSAAIPRAEIAKRGLVPATPLDRIALTLQEFRLGYAPAGWDGLVTFLRQQGASLAMAEQLGLVKRKDGANNLYDCFRSRLMFPVIDLQGRVVAFSGRVLPDPRTGLIDTETGKYINSPETPIYKKGETVFGLFQARPGIRARDEALIVEGNFDVVCLHASGIGHAVAPLGTAFTAEQARLLRRFTETATLFFDGDEAGRKATVSARDVCHRAVLRAKAVAIPRGEDPDSLLRKEGRDAVEKRLADARGLLEHLVGVALDDGFLSGSGEERVARIREVHELLATEDDALAQAMAQKYADQIVAHMPPLPGGLSGHRTLQQLYRSVEVSLQQPLPPPPPSPFPSVEEALIGCLLDQPDLLQDESVQRDLTVLFGDVVFVVVELQRALSEGTYDGEAFLAKVPEAYRSRVARRVTAPVHDDLTTARLELGVHAEKIRTQARLSDEQRVAAQYNAANLYHTEPRALQKREIKERMAQRWQAVSSSSAKAPSSAPSDPAS